MRTFLLIAFFTLAFSSIKAQDSTSYHQKGYSLTFINGVSTFDPALKKRLIETFYTVYPKLAKAYNKETAKQVTFVIDSTYDGVAATSGTRVVFSYKYMMAHPADIDVVTHEVMHIVQAYGNSDGPVWLTEGIADYVRSQFGVNNPGAHWTLPDYKAGQNYTNSYRITARFFTWLEKKVKPGIIKNIDQELRSHTYTNDSWKKLTGKTLDELWNSYTENPAI